MSTDLNLDSRRRSHSRSVWLWLSWIVVTALCGWFEYQRMTALRDEGSGIVAWLSGFWNAETTLPFVVLLSLPLLCVVAKVSGKQGGMTVNRSGACEPYFATRRQRRISTIVVFIVSLSCSVLVGIQEISLQNGFASETVRFAELPPAYHDEYSYLLQARTFLDGRLSYPPATVRPDLFHQFHVLNEQRTASRYFPWTGLWIAPFLAFGQPIVGQWLAGAIAAALLYLSAAQIVRHPAALAGGLLVAFSPGLAVFSSLLLAHHPTLLALCLFLWAFLRMLHSGQLRFAVIAGIGLALAMLGRPMTAAGFAFPFGIHFGGRLLTGTQPARLAAGIIVPLLLGLGVLAVVNHGVTGSWLRTGYQEYTDNFTPRHRYGFGNAVDALEPKSTRPAAVAAYDRWATNLTGPAAAENVWNRTMASVQWSLGIVPVTFGLLLALPVLLPERRFDSTAVANRTSFRLFFASLLSLHVVHIPYWFDGILHWHYVFETAPLLLLLTGAGLTEASGSLRRWLPSKVTGGWLAALVGVALLPGWVSAETLWGPSKVGMAVRELAWSRTRMEQFRRTINSDAVQKPALILIDERGSDFQLSYIVNPPDLRGPALVCRLPESAQEIDELRDAFPDRTLYVFNPQTFSVVRERSR